MDNFGEIIEICSAIMIALLFMRDNKFFKGKYKNVCCICLCFVISFLFSLKLWVCPFNIFSPGVDSSVFLYIGKSMRKGLIPYKEIFDHKGIVLYFIEYFGFLISPNGFGGIWILELINIFVTILILYKIATLFTEKTVIRLLSVFFVIQIFSKNYFFIAEGGNLVEEYALPWISLSLYYVLNYTINKKYKKYNIILIGVSFTLVFFLRVNMVAIWIPLILTVIISMLYNKKYKDFFHCIILFVIGVFIVVMPIFIYTVKTNSLYNMLDYYFGFNLNYTSSQASIKAIVRTAMFLAENSEFAVIVFFLSLVRNYKDKKKWINLIYFMVTLIFSSMSGRTYLHYGIILIPFFLLPTIDIIDLLFSSIKLDSNKIDKKVIVNVLLSISITGMVTPTAYNIIHQKEEIEAENSLSEYLRNNTNSNDDILVLGNNVSIYLSTNRSTRNKFFYQAPPIEVSEELFNDFVEEFNSKPSDYVVFQGDISEEFNDNDLESNLYKFLLIMNSKCEKQEYLLENYGDYAVYVKQ